MTATLETAKTINLGQLSVELGGVGLSMDDYGDHRVVSGEVSQASLEAAIEAHDAQPHPAPEPPEPPPPGPARLLQAQVDELTDLMFALMEGF